MRKYIRALEYNLEAVGKTIKSSKKRHTWTAKVDAREYRIVYTRSSMSGKNRIEVNSQLVFQDQSHFGNFNHTFEMDGTQFVIKQGPETYHLLIDGRDFADIFGLDKVKSILKKCRYEDEQEQKRMGRNSESSNSQASNLDARPRSSLKAAPDPRSKSAKKVHFNLEHNTFHDIKPPVHDLGASTQMVLPTEPRVNPSLLYPEIQAIVDQNGGHTSSIIYSSTMIDSNPQQPALNIQNNQQTPIFTSNLHSTVETNQFTNPSPYISQQGGTIPPSNGNLARSQHQQNPGTLTNHLSGYGLGHSEPLSGSHIPVQPQGDVGNRINQPRQQIYASNASPPHQNSSTQQNPYNGMTLQKPSTNTSQGPQRSYVPLQSSQFGADRPLNPPTLLGTGGHVPLFASQISELNSSSVGMNQPPPPNSSMWRPETPQNARLMDVRGSTSMIGSPLKQFPPTQSVAGSQWSGTLNNSQTSNPLLSTHQSRMIQESSVIGSKLGSPAHRITNGPVMGSTVRTSTEPGTPLGSFTKPNNSGVMGSYAPLVDTSSKLSSGFGSPGAQQVSQLSPSVANQTSTYFNAGDYSRQSVQGSQLNTRGTYLGGSHTVSRPQ